jgi:hypothetical protein
MEARNIADKHGIVLDIQSERALVRIQAVFHTGREFGKGKPIESTNNGLWIPMKWLSKKS